MGRSKGGFSTKIHTTVDASGNPLSFYLTPAEAHHLDGADKLLAELVADSVLAEKAYHAQERVIEQEEGNTAQR
jgi:IS5 family transposase